MTSDFSHAFVICAYKESEYLENMIQSILAQTVKTKVVMTTSTPNEFIKGIADKYDIPLYIRRGESNIRDDWNFAYDIPDTKWVTLAHQDDQYDKRYVEELIKAVSDKEGVIAYITDYIPIKKGKIGPRDRNSGIRRLLRTPLKFKSMARSRFWKKKILSLGNSICCPSVTYNKETLGRSFFTSDMSFNIDWDTFLKLALMDGGIAYTDKPLTFYRVHEGATSMDFIVSHEREKQDLEMFRKFWPDFIARFIMIFYKKAYDTYK